MNATTTPRRTTDPFREEHAAIKEHLRHMSQMIQAIPESVRTAVKDLEITAAGDRDAERAR